VRQIQNQALEKLRVMFEEDGQASRSAGREARPAGRRDSRAREAWVGSKG
jgi:hypothetical protein